MNTVQRTERKVVELTMEAVGSDGKINRRELGDFIMQVDGIWKETHGDEMYDDSYFVWGDEDGLHAEWVEEK